MNKQSHISALSPRERKALTRVIMELLEDWKVKAKDQVSLLALPEGTKPRALKKYHKDEPLPDMEEVNERLSHLLGIADALHTSYPRNAMMGAYWLSLPNDRFSGRMPITVMLEDGLEGIIAVRAHLDCAWDWYRDESS
ncbi:MAG: hypothetical protein BMS9Abin36_0389 [Gammaproteobacteria bacterium]|nr:MAG: hypothetical protein BMS9Abin36_0389 [Gammaproteobacteria bacterium]